MVMKMLVKEKGILIVMKVNLRSLRKRGEEKGVPFQILDVTQIMQANAQSTHVYQVHLEIVHGLKILNQILLFLNKRIESKKISKKPRNFKKNNFMRNKNKTFNKSKLKKKYKFNNSLKIKKLKRQKIMVMMISK